MELSFNTLKVYIPIIVTILSSITSGIFVAKNYIETNFVSAHEFRQMKIDVTIGVLENRKALLENKLYFLDICESTPRCSHSPSINFEIDKSLRELEDVRGHMEVYKSKRAE
jgi:hypothetical protein